MLPYEIKNFAQTLANGASVISIEKKNLFSSLKKYIQKDPQLILFNKKRFKKLAYELGISLEEISKEDPFLIKKLLKILTEIENENPIINLLPQTLKERYQKEGILPKRFEEEIIELLYKIECDFKFEELIKSILKISFLCVWEIFFLEKELFDLILGNSDISVIEIGISSKSISLDKVNILVNLKNPFFIKTLIENINKEEILKEIERVGAKGINLIGTGCWGQELAVRKGIPLVYPNYESLLNTNAIEGLITDVKGKYPEEFVYELTKKDSEEEIGGILKKIISRYSLRKTPLNIVDNSSKALVGFKNETLMYCLEGKFRAGYGPLIANIIEGNILGLAFLVGCIEKEEEKSLVELIKELLKENIWIFVAGGLGIILGEKGFLNLSSLEYTGNRLRGFLEVFGLPPVIYLGSVISASEIFIILKEIIQAEAIGKEFSDLPVIAIIPSMNNRILNISLAFITSGITTILKKDFTFFENEIVKNFFFLEIEKYFQVKFIKATDFKEVLNKTIDILKEKRKKLGIDKPKPRILFDMDTRRSLDSSKGISALHKLSFFGPMIFNKKISKIVSIIKDRCVFCLNCLRICPFLAIFIEDNRSVEINSEKCTACGICVGECPTKAIILKEI